MPFAARRGNAVPLRRFPFFALMLLPAALPAQESPAAAPPGAAQAKMLRGDDVMAAVEGQAITRRSLTYNLLQVDRTLNAKLGAQIAQRWKADKGEAAQYTLSGEEIYRAVYDGSTDYSPTLESMITVRLIGIRAQQAKITVTDAEAQARAHELFDAFRVRSGTTLSDADVLAKFEVPRDVFMSDMVFRLQSERLLALDYAKRNGHPLGPEDWIEVRALFATAEDLGDPAETEKQFQAAKKRIESWKAEIAAGKPFAETARLHNDDGSRDTGGLHGLSLRGTGTPDGLLFTLQPGGISEPVRVKNGWFVFTAARRGAALTEAERRAAWKAAAEAQMPAFLAGLRKAAHITIAP